MNDHDGTPQTAVSWAKTHSKHKPNIKYVLIVLASCIDEGNNCPSQNDLVEITGLSKPTIQRALGELEKDGTIAIGKNGGDKKNGGKKNCYDMPKMNPGKVDLPRVTGDTKVTADTKVTGDTRANPVSDTPVTPDTPGQIAVPHAHTHGDAATRVNDLSLTAKNKNNTPPVIPQAAEVGQQGETIASDDAGVLPSKPKRERKKQPAIVLNDNVTYRLRRGVAMRSWNIDPENPEMKAMFEDGDFARIGKIVSWLKRLQVTPEKLAEFYTWYKLQYPTAAAPKDADKFKDHFAAFVQAKTAPITLVTNPAYVPVQPRQHMPVSELVTPEQMAELQQALKARKAQQQGISA